ncbi:hypothetical protein [Pseudorhodoferax sp.]|uniref:hypothetical protein n=1 Tax=Pseudorhodoferax sp. TaxID=1993553 RepID=UPI0039E3135A
MDVVVALLHVGGFVMPAVCVALGTTLAARLLGGGGGMRWWAQWLLVSAAGVLALLGALWILGRDGSIAGYAALVACCATLAWLLTLRRR